MHGWQGQGRRRMWRLVIRGESPRMSLGVGEAVLIMGLLRLLGIVRRVGRISSRGPRTSRRISISNRGRLIPLSHIILKLRPTTLRVRLTHRRGRLTRRLLSRSIRPIHNKDRLISLRARHIKLREQLTLTQQLLVKALLLPLEVILPMPPDPPLEPHRHTMLAELELVHQAVSFRLRHLGVGTVHLLRSPPQRIR